MQVIMLRDVSGIGQKGALKSVSDGYALNFLIPNKLAIMATPEATKAIEKQRTEDTEALAAREKEWVALTKQLNGAKIPMQANASPQGHLYERISAIQVSAAIQKELKLAVPPSAISPKMSIKQTGEWPVEVKLGTHKATMTFVVRS